MSECDPLFVSVEEGDYHLSEQSPCINCGDPDRVPDPDETDTDGEPRVARGIIDMGADEVPYPHAGEPVREK